jgi:tRNA dimethylallyltransferase
MNEERPSVSSTGTLAVLILGPTASGKSAASMHVVRSLPAEIISIDSALVYRGMDIGTAKPTHSERNEAVHHLIDIIDPCESYSAARFANDANRLIDEIDARNRLPLLVGGTMLYAKALTEGLNELPQADLQIRTALDAQAAELGWPAMHRRLQAIDPQTAARLEPADAQRIQRALEVHEITGMPMTQLLATQRAAPNNRRWLKIALEPSDRAVLHARIARRLHQMIDEGLVEEVRALRARGDLNLSMPSMRCVGYRQIWEHLDGQYDLDTAIARAIAATRQLAKRQLTWLRSTPDKIVVDCLAPDANQQVLDLVQEHQ